MPRPNPKLEWCIVRFGEDMNWWVDEISDETHWDLDALSILDPRQISHVIDLCEPLRDYGFDIDSVESAFYTFQIEKEAGPGRVRLLRTSDSLLEGEEQLFALPDLVDEERGAYADLLDQITRFRVKMLNDLIDFDQNLTVDELEEEIRERNSADFFEGRAMHVFNELSAILEYVPEGYELDLDEEDGRASAEDEDIEGIPDFEEDESLEEDETMRWEDDEEDEDSDDEDGDEEGDEEDSDEDDDSDDEDLEEDKRGRGRRR